MEDGLYAKINTTKGVILTELFYELAPATVGNFVSLSKGILKNSIKKIGQPYYNDLKFHRVISDFMIQGGCPLGTGTGNPGYQFDDEFHPDLKHGSPGILSMANSGPGTNGSQFFITHVPTPWLDGKHAVFGKTVKCQSVVNSISKGDLIKNIEIIAIGKKANNFDALKAFNEFQDTKLKRISEQKLLIEKELKNLSKGLKTTATGLRYQILNHGNGKKAAINDFVSVHYVGKLSNGTIFDSSRDRGKPIKFQLGVGNVISGWDEGIQLLHVGDQAKFVIPSWLAYGERGAGGIIPPNANLIFEVELISVDS